MASEYGGGFSWFLGEPDLMRPAGRPAGAEPGYAPLRSLPPSPISPFRAAATFAQETLPGLPIRPRVPFLGPDTSLSRIGRKPYVHLLLASPARVPNQFFLGHAPAARARGLARTG